MSQLLAKSMLTALLLGSAMIVVFFSLVKFGIMFATLIGLAI